MGYGSWFMVQGFGFSVAHHVYKFLVSEAEFLFYVISLFRIRVSGFWFMLRILSFWFRVSGFWVRVSGFWFRIWGLGWLTASTMAEAGMESTVPIVTLIEGWASECTVHVAECRVQGSGFGVQGSGFRVQDSGFRIQGSGFKVQGSGNGKGEAGGGCPLHFSRNLKCNL